MTGTARCLSSERSWNRNTFTSYRYWTASGRLSGTMSNRRRNWPPPSKNCGQRYWGGEGMSETGGGGTHDVIDLGRGGGQTWCQNKEEGKKVRHDVRERRGIHDVEKKERGQTCQRQRKRAGMMSETARGERANMMSEKGERVGRHDVRGKMVNQRWRGGGRQTWCQR